MFLGEVPFVPGSAPEPPFAEVRDTLSYLYHKHGLRTWFGMLRRMAYSKVTGRPVIIHNGKKVAFYAQPGISCDDPSCGSATGALLAARIYPHSK